jgi:putative Mn2+ efflux pump MntP
MLIVLSFIVSIDSFFISCLASGKLKSNLVLILFSPLIHALFCFCGFLLYYRVLLSYKNHSILLYLLIMTLIFSGIYLFAAYNPQKKIKYQQNNISSIKPAVLMVLLLFCSLDAIIAGFVFAYWNVPMLKSIVIIFTVNLFMVLLPIIFKLLQKRII